MSFLSDYSIVTQGNECPRIFHTWAALSCISHLVGRRCWVNWGEVLGDIHTQMYVVFVGNAGSGKSTAMKIARAIVRDTEGYRIVGESSTKEVITQLMGSKDSECQKVFRYNDKPIKYSQLSIFANEFVNLINAGGNPIGMIDFFTDIWDQPVYKVETKNKGNDLIEGPYISILACMTTKTAKGLQTQRIISSGMTRRCLFIHGKHEGASHPFPKFNPEQTDAYQRLLLFAKKLKTFQGEFKWSDGATDAFESWYHTNTDRKHTEQDEILLEFLQTKPEYVIKVSTLLALAEDDIQLVIRPDHILNAIDVITLVEDGGRLLFSGNGTNENSPVTTEISRMLEMDLNPINVKLIYRTFIKDASIADIDLILESLARIDKAYKLPVTDRGAEMILYTSSRLKMEEFVNKAVRAGCEWNGTKLTKPVTAEVINALKS